MPKAIPSALLLLALVAAPAAAAATATPANPGPLFLAPQAYCEADCLWGPDVSCSGSTCSAQDDPNGWVQCDGGEPIDCDPQPLSVNISVQGCSQVGDKSIYSLSAYASGGNGSYSFSWTRAYSSNSTANPNSATSTDVRNRTVSVTVTSGGDSAYDSIYLTSPCGLYP